MKSIIFGAGCFWGVEEEFRRMPGVQSTSVGYAGGNTEQPTYEQVCTGVTGHAEVVQVNYDPQRISLSELLRKFWKIHTPSRESSTGQYRSIIFYTTVSQKSEILAAKESLAKSGRFPNGIFTQILPAPPFYAAEERHQQYHAKREQRLRHG